MRVALPRLRLSLQCPPSSRLHCFRAFSDTTIPESGESSNSGENPETTHPTDSYLSSSSYVAPTTTPTKYEFDLIIIGSGPAAQSCAVSSARR